MSTSVLPSSDQPPPYVEEVPYCGHLTFTDEEEALKQLDEIREYVRRHGTCIANGASHGAIAYIAAIRRGGMFRPLSCVDNHDRVPLTVDTGDPRGDVGVDGDAVQGANA